MPLFSWAPKSRPWIRYEHLVVIYIVERVAHGVDGSPYTKGQPGESRCFTR